MATHDRYLPRTPVAIELHGQHLERGRFLCNLIHNDNTISNGIQMRNVGHGNLKHCANVRIDVRPSHFLCGVKAMPFTCPVFHCLPTPTPYLSNLP